LNKTVRNKEKSRKLIALEIGTGTGRGSRVMAEAGYKTVGLDYLLEPLRQASQKKSEANKNPFYLQADVFKTPFTDESFDLILDWGVFHHIRRADTKLFLAVVTQLLKKDGRFLLGCFSTGFRHHGEKKRKRSWTRHRGHYDRFSTRKELRKIFTPFFIINSIAETNEGFYLIDMSLKDSTQ
jgi:SAM-dependent methyltransferase